MSINITLFGQIADITGSGSLALKRVADTDEMVAELTLLYPALKQLKYAVAVDKKIIRQNTPLTSDSVVALLPPFSGG